MELSSLGITHIWLTGIIRHATGTDYSKFGLEPSPPDILKGLAGSPYAIKDYYDIDPDLAVSVTERMDEFTSLIDRMHSVNLKVIIDFVPNHVSRDYRSLQKPPGITDLGENDDLTIRFHPDNNFYYIPGETLRMGSFTEYPAKATGNDVFNSTPSKTDWYETIKINYGIDYANGTNHFNPVPDTWIKMSDILLYWASKGIDGFRCDMAGMVPVSFWEYAIRIVKKVNPEILFIAELYEPSRYREYLEIGGFDYLYDKAGFYDTLRSVISYGASTRKISRIWQSLEGMDDRMLRFMETHDEQRISSAYFAGNPWKGLPATALAGFMNRGPVMIYAGQEVGEPAAGAQGFSGDDGRTSIFDYSVIPEIQKWYSNGSFDESRLSDVQRKLRKEYAVICHLSGCLPIREGAFYDLMWVNEEIPCRDLIYAFLRYHPDSPDPVNPDSGIRGLMIWIIAICFDHPDKEVIIRIPTHALEMMGLTIDQHFNFGPLTNLPGARQNLMVSQLNSPGVRITTGYAGYGIVQAFFPW
ncbi:MAG: alpha-amylase family glycosyl hydrolase [Bacteroidota bacterium]